MAVFHKTPIEMFVRAFVRQRRKSGAYGNFKEAGFFTKAVTLIDIKLGGCCADDPEDLSVIPQDNILTNTIKMYLATMPRAGNELSLNRTRDILANFGSECCG